MPQAKQAAREQGIGSRIRRAALPRDHFTVVENQIIRDARLSRRARMLWIEMASHREGWTTSERALTASGPEGRAAIRTSLKELEDFGYLEHVQTRNGDGTLGAWEYILRIPDA